MKAVASVLTLFLHMPIWYFLVYQILVMVQASELMFFLFWVYVPIGILASVLSKLADSADK